MNIPIHEFLFYIFIAAFLLNLSAYKMLPVKLSPMWVTMTLVPIGTVVYFVVVLGGFDAAIMYAFVFSFIPCFFWALFGTLIRNRIFKK